MKILLVNKFFYPRGGDCIVAMTTRKLLMEKGHEVRVFSMSFPENIELEEADSFAPEVKFNGNVSEKFKSLKRLMGADEVKERFRMVLDEFRPDVVHLHNIHSYLSPVVGELARKRGIKVVWTMHDYKLLCPSYSCRRPNGDNCELCFHNPYHVVAHRCMKQSTAQSITAYLEALIWNKKRLQKNTDIFIAPSRFIYNKMLEVGFPERKLMVIPNFIDDNKLHVIEKIHASRGEEAPEKYFSYVGRLSDEKGVQTLIEAAISAGVKLKIGGSGPLADILKKKYEENSNIEFLGQLNAEEVARILLSSQASVVPSEWYENNPLSVIESLCCGTPVIGASIGGIPELIDSESGITFTSGNTEELAKILSTFSQRDNFNRRQISERSINRFSKENYYKQIMAAYRAEQ